VLESGRLSVHTNRGRPSGRVTDDADARG
jgi:hypothetical protein